ncbi:HlyD family secretion protein [Methylomonas sp. MgM2]
MSFVISKKNLSISLFFAIVSVAGIFYWRQAIHPFESTDNAYLKAHIGLISPKESGYVAKVLFQDNQQVAPGDLLVVIDDHDFRAKVSQAEAQLHAIAARIETLESQKRTQTAKISQQVANAAAAAAELQRAGRDLTRISKLAADGAMSAQSRDNAEAVHMQANAERDRVQSSRLEAESELTSLDAQIAESRAQLQVAEAALELARINLSNTRIVAPIAGVIGNRSVQVGQLVQPGAVLAYLIPADDLFVEANFKETQIGDMRRGQAVDIKVDAYSNTVFEGVVDSFAPASGSEFSLLPPENATGNFTKIVRRVPVKISFKSGDEIGRLRPGLSAVVKVRVR